MFVKKSVLLVNKISVTLIFFFILQKRKDKMDNITNDHDTVIHCISVYNVLK